GYADMVDGLLGRMKEEMGDNPTVVATGGFGSLISDITQRIDHVDPLLTMKGLKAVYAKNKNARSEQ
ncbi:MAG: pantothenate kinase, partial [bacterium]|nr:pantothenate kinase [bacterium]